MSPLSRRRTVRRSAAALMCAIVGTLMMAPGAATGAAVTFGTPSANVTFGKEIVFTQPYSGTGVRAAEIAIEAPGDVGASVAAVENPGSTSLSYTMDTSTGGLSPFQPLVAYFRVTFADGTVQAGPEVGVTYADDRYKWKSKIGKLVTVHWIDGSDAFGQQLLTYGEQGLSKSAAFLGVEETKPIDFYIYNTQSAFQSALGVTETIGGVAETTYRSCFALVTPNDLSYGSTVVPHELTHIVFSDLTDNPYDSPPRWLNEGMAVYLSEGYASDNRQLIAQAVRSGDLVPLAALAGYFALDTARIFLSYAESVSAVDFMVRKYGKSAIQKLLQTYAKGATDGEAFTAAFGMDAAAFDTAWLADNGVTASPTYGPQPAPTGPVPPGWTGSSATVPPLEPTASTATGSSPPGGQGSNLPNGSESSAFVLAGLIALGGLILLGVGILLYVESQPGRTYPDGPPPA